MWGLFFYYQCRIKTQWVPFISFLYHYCTFPMLHCISLINLLSLDHNTVWLLLGCSSIVIYTHSQNLCQNILLCKKWGTHAVWGNAKPISLSCPTGRYMHTSSWIPLTWYYLHNYLSIEWSCNKHALEDHLTSIMHSNLLLNSGNWHLNI